MRISADVLRGYTDVILLRRLAAGDGYGYRVNRQVARISEDNLTLKEATLYTAFRRMEEAGLISSFWGSEETGARRHYYSLTESGREKLAAEQENWAQTRKILDRLILSGDEEEGGEADE